MFVFYVLLDPVCRTISTVGNNNPDPDQKCDFAADKGNNHTYCRKTETRGKFWCPTKGWGHDSSSKWGICSSICDKQNGKNDHVEHFHDFNMLNKILLKLTLSPSFVNFLTLIFVDCNMFRKVSKASCWKTVDSTETLDQAIVRCTNDKNCSMFYNDACDDTGPFKICGTADHSIDSLNGSCAYVKQSDEDLTINDSMLLDPE